MALLNTIQSIQWHTTRARRPKGAPGTSGSPETPESKWKHETLYVVLDSVLSSMRNRFEKNRSLYEMLSVFSPNCFPRLSEMYNTVYDLTRAVTSFCEKYNLDSKRCAEELFCFARAYSKFHSSEFVCTQADDRSSDEDDMEQDHDQRDADVDYNDFIEVSDEQRDEHLETKKNGNHGSSFTGALHILCNEMYHLKDAFPELCKVYAIISAIPISSCTAERSFSALKRVKTRLRSTMVQERLEGLLLLSVERKILLTLTKESVIDSFARSSSHLSSALL